MIVLVVDVGGSHVKLRCGEAGEPRQFDSAPDLTPQVLVDRVKNESAGCRYDAVSLGIPTAVGPRGPTKEPGNLGGGWAGFDFEGAFEKPVRVANDAAMQALGAYDGGRMLFLGFGTGVGSAFVAEHVLIPLELGDLPWQGKTLADHLGRKGFERMGKAAWREAVIDAATKLKAAFAVDHVMLGGGKAGEGLLDPLPSRLRRGGNHDSFKGGFRLWEQRTEPHNQPPPAQWRVIA
jgi:polyphosphate glucokinase